MSIKDTKDSLKMDSTWKKKQRVQRSVDERLGIDLEYGTADVSRQAEMEILGEGLMCPRHEEDKVSK